MENKKIYEIPSVEITNFEVSDVLTDSHITFPVVPAGDKPGT